MSVHREPVEFFGKITDINGLSFPKEIYVSFLLVTILLLLLLHIYHYSCRQVMIRPLLF